MPFGRKKENFTKPREKASKGERDRQRRQVVAEPGGLSADPAVLGGRAGRRGREGGSQ